MYQLNVVEMGIFFMGICHETLNNLSICLKVFQENIEREKNENFFQIRVKPFFMWLVQYWIESNGILLPIIDLKCSFNGYGLSILNINMEEFYFSLVIFFFLFLFSIDCANKKTSHSLGWNIFIIALFYFKWKKEMEKKVTLNWDEIQFNDETVVNVEIEKNSMKKKY